MGINFDNNKLQIVHIDEVRPNSWNPKQKQTKDYKKVMKGIEAKGLRQPVIVRENEGLEIIDGEQRWTACKELGFEDVLIYNEGKISDKEAKELTIWYQVQVPFDHLELAGLIKDMKIKYEHIEIPYTEIEIADMVKLDEFDFSQFDNTEEPIENKTSKTIECPNCQHEFKI